MKPIIGASNKWSPLLLFAKGVNLKAVMKAHPLKALNPYRAIRIPPMILIIFFPLYIEFAIWIGTPLMPMIKIDAKAKRKRLACISTIRRPLVNS